VCVCGEGGRVMIGKSLTIVTTTRRHCVKANINSVRGLIEELIEELTSFYSSNCGLPTILSAIVLDLTGNYSIEHG
jgi:hypothetical protein